MADWFEQNTTPIRPDAKAPPGVPAAQEATAVSGGGRGPKRKTMGVREGVELAGPSMAATLATGLVPPAGLAIGGVKVAAPLIRMLAAPAAAFPTEMAAQVSRGEPVDAGDAGKRAAMEFVAQLTGETLGGVTNWAGRKMVGAGFNVQKPAAAESAEMQSALQGHKVAPSEAEIVDQAIKEGIMPGPPIIGGKARRGEIGTIKLDERMKQPMRRRAGHLAEQTAKGKTFTRQDYMRDVGDFKRQILAKGGTQKDIDTIDRFVTEFVEGGRGPSQIVKGRKVQGKMKRDTPIEGEVMKEGRQAKATALYNSSAKGRASLRAQFDEFTANAIMRRLEELTPPAVPGGVGDIEATNREYRELLPLETAMKNAELPRTSVGDNWLKSLSHQVPYNVTARLGYPLAKEGTLATVRNLPRTAGLGLEELRQYILHRGESSEGIVE